MLSHCVYCSTTVEFVNDLGIEPTVSPSFFGSNPASPSNIHVDNVHSDIVVQPDDSAETMDVLIRRLERILMSSGSINEGHGRERCRFTAEAACEQCVNKVVHESKRLNADLERERQAVLEALERLESDEAADTHRKITPSAKSAPLPEATTALVDATRDEDVIDALTQELADIEKEEQPLMEDYEKLQREIRALEKDEAVFTERMIEYQLNLTAHEEELAMVDRLTECASNQLKRLQETNVTNDVFNITSQGPFAAINNFRLGKLPDQNVGWDEVNVAWGQACLLLDVIIKRLKIPCETFPYRLVPKGSFSTIVRAKDNMVCELYGSDGGLSRFFPSGRRFDTGISFFLDCMEEVVLWLHRRDPNVRLPFKIESSNALIGGFSVRLQFTEYERWTKALKYMLINLKWMIAFMEANLK